MNFSRAPNSNSKAADIGLQLLLCNKSATNAPLQAVKSVIDM